MLKESNLYPEDLNDFLNVKEQKEIEGVLNVKTTKREKEIKRCLFSPVFGCSTKLCVAQMLTNSRKDLKSFFFFLNSENEICWIYFAWGGISSAATDLHKIYKNRNGDFKFVSANKKVAGLNQM